MEGKLYFHAWKENCLMMHSHPMPIKSTVLSELAQESAQLIQKHLRLKDDQAHLLLFITNSSCWIHP